ncbi:MAG TPA: acetyl-CoA C-acetyltransferase [Streptosporangiaceae bacterium]|nr:acetyl-CoA C-acetyltransferase [Streptosporangiaceae bacterium]
MRDAVICEPVRTPIGRFGGALRDVPAHQLATTAVRAVLERTGLGPADIDEVLLGQCYATAEAPAIGRVAALDAGLPVGVTGLQLDRRCGSGLQAVIYAAMQVQTGASDVVVAGGAESMSSAAFYSTSMRWGSRGEGVLLHDTLARGRTTAGGKNFPVPGGMVETAENLRREYRISRTDQDQLALRSHQRAVAAQQSGVFAQEIVPVPVKTRKGTAQIDTDEHPRADTSLESLAALRPIMLAVDPDATVTAGNASGQNDAASVCVVTHPDQATRLGLRPLARLVSWAVAGVPPSAMGIGPVPSTAKALDRASLKLSDIDLIELNEAFAAQSLAVIKDLGLDPAKVNPLGGAIALGHPLGATGAVRTATLMHGMRRRKHKYGMVTMCIGTGMGAAGVFESL